MSSHGALSDLVAAGYRLEAHRPWPRVSVTESGWRTAVELLAAGRATLLALFGEPQTVHMALLDEASAHIAVLSLACHHDRFPTVSAHHLPALRLERTIFDLFSLAAEDALDERPGSTTASGASRIR